MKPAQLQGHPLGKLAGCGPCRRNSTPCWSHGELCLFQVKPAHIRRKSMCRRIVPPCRRSSLCAVTYLFYAFVQVSSETGATHPPRCRSPLCAGLSSCQRKVHCALCGRSNRHRFIGVVLFCCGQGVAPCSNALSSCNSHCHMCVATEGSCA